MHETTQSKSKPAGNWLAAIILASAHLFAFGMLYLVLVQLNWSFQDFYRAMGVKLTPEFERVASVSNYIAASTPVVLLAIAFDVIVVFRLACRGNRWTSAYSHAVLLCLGFTGFVWTAWSVEPMAWIVPGAVNAPVVNNAQAGNAASPTMDLRDIDQIRSPRPLLTATHTAADGHDQLRLAIKSAVSM